MIIRMGAVTGDNKSPLTVILEDNGVPADLTGVTTVTLHAKPIASDMAAFDVACSVVGAATGGKVTALLLSAHLNALRKSDYKVEWEAAWQADQVNLTWPTEEAVVLTVRKQLG